MLGATRRLKGCFTTAPGGCSTPRSRPRSDWPRRASSLLSGAKATPTTMPSPSRRSARSRPRSSGGGDPGADSADSDPLRDRPPPRAVVLGSVRIESGAAGAPILHPSACVGARSATATPLDGVYRRHELEKMVLHWIVREHLEIFLARAGGGEGAGYPRFVEQELLRRLRALVQRDRAAADSKGW